MHQGYNVYSTIGNGQHVRVKCMSNGVSDPDGLVDDDGVVNTAVNTSGLDQPAAGKYTLTLKGTYRRIEAKVILVDTTLGQACEVYQIDDVNSSGVRIDPPVVYWKTITTSTGAAVQTNDKPFIIDLVLFP